jgi:hypothetical protein
MKGNDFISTVSLVETFAKKGFSKPINYLAQK